jgi:hypothetical protein
MEYDKFLTIILSYKKLTDDISELHGIGFDFFEGKYRLISTIDKMFEASISSHYTEEGVGWIEWFVYEADFGTRDFSELPSYRPNEEGEMELVSEPGEPRWGATDESGNPICYSYESLYEYVEQYKIKK